MVRCSMKKIEALLGLVVSGSLALSHPATAQSLVNAAFQASLSGSGEALSPEFSSDGRYVFFLSTSRNLVTNDTLARSQNLYRFDVMSRATALVSASSTGIGGANDHVAFPSMSSDGRFAAFVSAANNLVANDSNSASDVFMRDLVTGSTTLVSAD